MPRALYIHWGQIIFGFSRNVILKQHVLTKILVQGEREKQREMRQDLEPVLIRANPKYTNASLYERGLSKDYQNMLYFITVPNNYSPKQVWRQKYQDGKLNYGEAICW